MKPDVVANLVGEQRMLVGRIVADQQNGRCVEHFAHRGGDPWLAVQSARECSVIRSTVMVHVVRLEDHTGKLREQIILFVHSTVGSDHADRGTTVLVSDLGKTLAN